MSDRADSAGVPWEGRAFHDNPHAGDSGETPAVVAAAIESWRTGDGTFETVIASLADARLLIPLVAHAGEDFDPNHPVMEDKVQELSIVTVAGPNGEKVIPAFTSVAAMSAWNSDARPIPVEARRVALAAAAEDTHRMVLNPGTDSIVVRRPALWTIAQGLDYRAAGKDPEFAGDIARLLTGIDGLLTAHVIDADPRATGEGPDVELLLELRDGLTTDAVREIVGEIHGRITRERDIVERIDALGVTLRRTTDDG